MVRSSSAFKKIIESLEKKQKILYMLYKSSYMAIKPIPNDLFYLE